MKGMWEKGGNEIKCEIDKRNGRAWMKVLFGKRGMKKVGDICR
jgi:hypothetical protein